MKKMVSVYATPSPLYDELNEKAKEYARTKDIEYVWVPQQPFSKEAVIDVLKDADAALIDVEPYDNEIFSQIKERCKIVIRYGVGFDKVNLADATANGIVVSRTTAANAEGVAEMAFTMIMAAKRTLPANRKLMESGNWERIIGEEMLGKKLGILGFGAIGRKLAKLFRGFDTEVYVYDPYLTEEACAEAGAKLADLETIFRECDAISVHTPYSEETHHLVDEKLLSLMKEKAVIVCTSRGNIIDEQALYEALRDRKIFGAGLDVFGQEPLPADSPLLTLDNIILTPHAAAQTYDSLWNMYKKAIDVADGFFRGEPFAKGDLLNPEVQG